MSIMGIAMPPAIPYVPPLRSLLTASWTAHAADATKMESQEAASTATFLSTPAAALYTSHETNTAMFKLQTATEFMFSLAFDDMTTTMPEGTPIDIMKLTDSNANNDFVLNNEVMIVAYEDPAADPLKFTVTLTWDSRMSSARSASISSGRVR